MNKEYRKMSKSLIFIIYIVAIIFIWCLSWYLIDLNIIDSNERGVFGDKFGAINSLFSGLAFVGLIVTLRYQKEELELQRQELAETRKELEGQKKEFEEQNKIMRRQSFENTLFNMLSLQQEIVNELHYISKDRVEFTIESKGRSVFDFFYNTKITYFGDYRHSRIYGIRDLIKYKGNVKAYVSVEELSIFDSYFRHLYRIFKYIDKSPLIDESQRYDYTCIVRAQLSENELLMLFYNALNIHENGEYKFKNLIERYAIFNNLREYLLARGNEDYKLYGDGAYTYKPS